MRLRVIPGLHRPLSDTWLMASAMARVGVADATVADICTGSGAIAIAACVGGARRVVAVDVSRRAVLNTRLNARANGCRVLARRGDLLRGLGHQRFDLIVSNPPYIPAESDRLPRHTRATALDAGKDGRALIDRICREAREHLLPGGSVLMVHSSICDEQATRDLLGAQGLETTVMARSRGALGPVLRSRAPMLRERSLLDDVEEEDLLVIRGRLAADVSRGSAERRQLQPSAPEAPSPSGASVRGVPSVRITVRRAAWPLVGARRASLGSSSLRDVRRPATA